VEVGDIFARLSSSPKRTQKHSQPLHPGIS